MSTRTTMFESPEAVYSPEQIERFEKSKMYAAPDMVERFKAGTGDSKWSGVPSGQKDWANWGRGVMLAGDPNALATVQGARNDLVSACPDLAVPSIKRRLEHGHFTGFNPNVPMLMHGRPDAFSQWASQKRMVTRAVQLVCELGGNCTMTADQLKWAGAAATVGAELLQEAGYAVEVWGVTVGSAYDADTVVTAVQVKAAENHVIPDQLASVVASPAFFRVGIFMSFAIDPSLGASATLGYSEQMNKSHLDALGFTRSYVVPRCYTLNDARKALTNLISDINSGTVVE